MSLRLGAVTSRPLGDRHSIGPAKKKADEPVRLYRLFSVCYLRQYASFPFVITTQFASFSRAFTPVSAPVEVLSVSTFPSRVNSIPSPFAVPSKVFGPPAPVISIVNLSPFFVTLSDEAASAPDQRPAIDSALPVFVAAGLPDGEAAGEAAGLALAAGAGDAGGLTSVFGSHATAPRAATADRAMTSLLILFVFMVSGQSHIGRGLTWLRDSGSFSRSSLLSDPATMLL
jgi:hypothetical protein